MSVRLCGHEAPRVCQVPECRDWREAFRLDICCACQAARRSDRQAAYAVELAAVAHRLERRRQLRYLRQARGTIAAIHRELTKRTKPI